MITCAIVIIEQVSTCRRFFTASSLLYKKDKVVASKPGAAVGGDTLVPVRVLMSVQYMIICAACPCVLPLGGDSTDTSSCAFLTIRAALSIAYEYNKCRYEELQER